MLKYDIYVHKLHKRRRPLLEHVKPKEKYEKKMNKKKHAGYKSWNQTSVITNIIIKQKSSVI